MAKTKTKVPVVQSGTTTYEVVGDGKVRKTNSLTDLASILSETEKDQARFMTTLFNFLKDKDEEVSRKRDKILIRGFLLGFGGGRFRVWDTFNYSKERDDFKIPFPTPTEVWDFIKQPKLLKPLKKVEEELEENLETKVAQIRKLKSERPLTKSQQLQKEVDDYLDREAAKKLKEKEREEKKAAKLIPPEPVDLEARRKKVINTIKRTKNPKLLYDKIKDEIPHRSFKVFLGKICRPYLDGKMRAPKFLKEVLKFVQEFVFTEKPKPAPKFIGVQWYDINEMIEDETTVLIKNKSGEKIIPKSTFLVMWLLHKRPKLMVGIMQYLTGKLTQDKFLKYPTVRDRFTAYDPKLFSTWNEDLYKLCVILLSEFHLYNPLDVIYKNEPAVKDLKVGDNITTYWPEHFEIHKGKVISITNSIEIRYDDGEVFPLFKHQIKAQLWKKI